MIFLQEEDKADFDKWLERFKKQASNKGNFVRDYIKSGYVSPYSNENAIDVARKEYLKCITDFYQRKSKGKKV